MSASSDWSDLLGLHAEDVGTAYRQLRGVNMRQVELFHFYHFGARLSSLRDMRDGGDREQYLLRAVRGIAFLEGILEDVTGPTPLDPVRSEAELVLKMAKLTESKPLDQPIARLEVLGLQTALTDFEKAFRKELRKQSVFEVEQVGIYRTDSLIEEADRVFTPDVLGALPENAKQDWRSAGRCLAFDLGTACGFHTLRATESVVHRYYVVATGDVNISRKQRNWGAYVRLFTKFNNTTPGRVDPKLVALIDQVREHHRNVLIHPEDSLTPSEAYVLFNICQSVIVSLTRETSRLLAP